MKFRSFFTFNVKYREHTWAAPQVEFSKKSTTFIWSPFLPMGSKKATEKKIDKFKKYFFPKINMLLQATYFSTINPQFVGLLTHMPHLFSFLIAVERVSSRGHSLATLLWGRRVRVYLYNNPPPPILATLT